MSVTPAAQGAATLPDPRTTDAIALTKALCDIPSVSGDERAIADATEALLRSAEHLEVLRDGDAIVARTNLGRAQRVVIAGHLDTVPIKDNLPTQDRTGPDGEPILWGRGTVDMKGGTAVALHLAVTLSEPTKDVTWVFYDHEEVDADLNGLGRVVREHPQWLQCDFAVLGEPTAGGIEGGCNGTLRAEVRTFGRTAHSARAWRGHNAIHDLAEVLQRLADYTPAEVEVDSLVYRESLNAVGIHGGIATNMIPDAATVVVNYRFAPSATPEEAFAHVADLFAGFDVRLTDAAPGARPGLDHPAAVDFMAAVNSVTGGVAGPKYGWTDVARFSALGIPAVNFGPGDPSLAHADDEHVPTAQITDCARALTLWLSTPQTANEGEQR